MNSDESKLTQKELDGMRALAAIKEGLQLHYPECKVSISMTITDKITGEKLEYDI